MKTGMADRQVTLAGQNFTLRYSVRALAAMQEHWQLASFQQVEERLAGMADGLGIDDIVCVLWAGLRTHHKELTTDDVLGLLDDGGLEGVMEAVGAAFGNALPDADDVPDAVPEGDTSPKKTRRKGTAGG